MKSKKGKVGNIPWYLNLGRSVVTDERLATFKVDEYDWTPLYFYHSNRKDLKRLIKAMKKAWRYIK